MRRAEHKTGQDDTVEVRNRREQDDERTEENSKCLCISGGVWSQLGRPTASD